MTKAIYAFSGDPITYGHINIIQRAARDFETVIVGIGVNPSKHYLFTLDERKAMAKRALEEFKNVTVIAFEGLLVDYAYEHNIGVIVKGVRNATDADYENTLHQVGESQKLGIDTYILFARTDLAHVSSSMVKGLQKEQGDIHSFVPLSVKQCLESRISGQYIVGITGEIGCGKSYVASKFVELGTARGISVYDIDLDKIGHQILSDLAEPRYDAVRAQIAQTFGAVTRRADGSVDRKTLGEMVFNDSLAREKLNAIMATPMQVRLRRELHGKKGILLLNAALIAETNMAYRCNNNVVIVRADKQTQEKRLAGRGLTTEQMQKRVQSQYDEAHKKARIEAAIQTCQNGTIWTIDNSEGKDEIEKIFEKVVAGLQLK